MKNLRYAHALALLLAAISILNAKPLLESDFSDVDASRDLFRQVNIHGAAIVEFDSGGLKLEIPQGVPDYLFVRTDEGIINDDGAKSVKYTLVFENQSPAESIVSFGFWIRLGDAEFGNGYRLLLYRDPGMSQVGLQRFKDKRPGQQGDEVWLSDPNQFGHFGQSGQIVEVEILVKNSQQAVDFHISVNGTVVDVADADENRITAGQGVGFNLDTNGAPGSATVLCDKVTVTVEGK